MFPKCIVRFLHIYILILHSLHLFFIFKQDSIIDTLFYRDFLSDFNLDIS